MNSVAHGFDDEPFNDPAPRDQEDRHLMPPILKQLWNAVLRRKWVILGIVAAALAAGVIITLMMPREYTAQSQLEIERQEKQITNVQGVDTQASVQDQEFYSTQYALLRTRPVVERVVRDLQLTRSDDFFAAHGVDPEQLEQNSAASRNQRTELAVDLLLANSTIEPVRTSRLVGIQYESRSPEMSARIANGWAEAFIASTVDRKFASSADARTILENRLETLRQRLEESERNAVNYAADQGIVSLDQVRDGEGRTLGNRTLAGVNLDALNTALNEAIAERVRAEAGLRGAGANSPEALNSATLGSLRQQREVLAAEASRLSVQFEPEYPQLRAVNRQIASLDAAIARETGRIGSSRRDAFEQASQREAALRSQVEALRAQLVTQNRASIQYNIYQREADTNRQLYDALLQRYKEIGVAATVGISNIAIVERAEVPKAPSSPNLLLNLALATLAGLLLAVLVTIGLEQIDEGVRTPDEVRARLGIPLLGTVPEIDGELLTEIRDSKSELYEAYFSARSNLAFTTAHGFPRSLSITSTRPAEGKSSTSLALALILARLGKRVLLIDGDMRSPTVDRLMETDNDYGLSNFLAGEDDWRKLLRTTGGDGLQFMTAGPIPPSAAELLSTDRLGYLLTEALTEFDHVLMDSPPVLGLTDAPIISRAVEGCVIVIESAGAPLRGIRNSIARIEQVGGHIFGAILTKVEHVSGGYGYGYGYGYSYGLEDDRGTPTAAA